jgi:hypothetical protein
MEKERWIYGAEHSMAWFMAIGGLILAGLAALVSFDVISLRTIEMSGDGISGVTGDRAATTEHFQDGMLLFVPAIAAGLLALGLHMTEHHRSLGTRRESSMWTAEHSMAYVAALATIVFGVLDVIVGFDVLNEGYTWRDGLTWGMLAIPTALMSVTLHAVRHHEYVAEEADIRMLVEERVGRAFERAANSVGTERGTERR